MKKTKSGEMQMPEYAPHGPVNVDRSTPRFRVIDTELEMLKARVLTLEAQMMSIQSTKATK